MLKTNKTRIYIIIFCINALAAFVFYNFQTINNSESDDLLSHGQSIGIKVKKELITELKQNTSHVDSLGKAFKKYKSFSIGLADSSQITSDLKQLIKKLPFIDGVGLTFHNFSISENSLPKSYSVYIHRIEGVLKVDYKKEKATSSLLLKPVAKKTPIWIGPYLDSAENKRFVSYEFPAVLDSFEFVLSIDYSTTSLYLLLNSLGCAQVGFPYLISREGEFLAHPNDECRSLDSIGKINEDQVLVKLAKEIKDGNDFDPKKYYHRNTISNKMCWEQVIPLEGTGYFLCFSVIDQQIYRNPHFFNVQRRKHIRQSLFVFIALLVIELLFIWWLLGKNKNLFQFNIFTICYILIIILLFSYHYRLKYPLVDFSDSDIKIHESLTQNIKDLHKSTDTIFQDSLWNLSMLLDKDRVRDYISIYSNHDKSNKNHLIQIPTGIYIQTIKFLDSYSAKLTGYIWQLDSTKMIKNKGVIFPDAESCSMEMIDSLTILLPNGNTTCLYRWYFTIEIREIFNYKMYPFDRSNLWIRIWSKDFNKNPILLTPDINSYILYHPSYRPGIDNEIVIPGWEIESSYFSYEKKNYNTNFGASTNHSKNVFPELHFNIIIKRNYLDPIVSRIIPLFVLLLMTFSILYISKKDDTLNVAIACSGLLFVAVFEHINLRRTLDMPGIIYLEYFYFITYLLLVLVAINVSLEKWIWNQFNVKALCADLIQKTYWFIALFILTLITLYTFY